MGKGGLLVDSAKDVVIDTPDDAKFREMHAVTALPWWTTIAGPVPPNNDAFAHDDDVQDFPANGVVEEACIDDDVNRAAVTKIGPALYSMRVRYANPLSAFRFHSFLVQFVSFHFFR